MTDDTAPQNAEALEALGYITRYPALAERFKDLKKFDDAVETIRAALNQPRTVKPLVWEKHEKFSEARSPLGVASVYLTQNKNWGVLFNNDHLGFFKSEDKAKAAAEMHWQAKIRGCLV